jgi:hypothetical protein
MNGGGQYRRRLEQCRSLARQAANNGGDKGVSMAALLLAC